MNKPVDADVRKMMEENSIRTTVVSYLMTLVYAVAGALAAMAGREMIEKIAMKLIYTQEMEVSQYSGFRRISQISALVLMIGLWITSFMLAWHKIEKAGSLKKRIQIGLCWIIGALALYAIFGVVQYLVVGFWPTLSGSV